MSYPLEKLGNHIDILCGFAFKSTDFVNAGIPVIKIKNITPPSVSLDDLSYVTRAVAQQQAKFQLKRGDVLIALTGSHINQMSSVVGRVARVQYDDITLLNQRVGKVVITNPESINLDYVYYFLSQDDTKLKLATNAGGAANQANISPSDIKNLKIPFPPIEVQNHIADILSAYDNLIENNQKQIRLLEEAARRLYKEWFVDFRFPGHESVTITDGVPMGWRKIQLGELIEYEIGGGWGEETQTHDCDKEGFVIRGTDLYGLTHGAIESIPLRYHSANNLSTRTLLDGDIVFEVSGGSKTEGVARTAFINDALLKRWNKPVMCASFCKLIRVSDIRYSQLLYDYLQYLRKCGKTAEYDKKSASSIVNYRWKDFLSYESVLIPDDITLLSYNRLASAIYRKIVNGSLSIELCANDRDRLLPKLMRGELEV